MKKILFLAPMALALAACSEKEIVEQGNTGGYNDLDHSYLAVSIVPANTSSTRTVPTGDDFRDGEEFENKVSSIRFYFFDEEGNAAPVKADGASYYDVQKEEIIQNQYSDDLIAGPVESVVSSIIVIESRKGDGKPVYMAAVLNHNGDAPKDCKDIKALQEWYGDYSKHGEGEFTMSSTVYQGNKVNYQKIQNSENLQRDPTISENEELVAVPVYENISKSREEAIENTATIYVERVLAKVTASIGITEESHAGIIDLGEDGYIYKVGYVGNQGLIEEPADATKIYVKFLGWNVTGTRNNSRIVKDINTSWTYGSLTPLAGWRVNWNDRDNFRSYWAINPKNVDSETPIDDNYNFFKFATETGENSGVWTADNNNKTQAWSYDFTDKSYAYLQENAGKFEDGTENDIYKSKIIVAAQLVDQSGNPLELIEWQGDIYDYGTDENKVKVLDALAADTDLYIEDRGEWRRINHDDVKIVFTNAKDADEAYERNNQGERRYYVYLELNNPDAKYGKWKFTEATDDEESKWEIDTNDGEGYPSDSNLVTNALRSVGYIKHWNTGYTYYWVDIQHFGEKDVTGEYGVVRNHWYDYTFTDVKGLGIPVSNPNEIIYPEDPGDPEYFYLAAEIKILSWRIVKNAETSLGW